MPLRSGSFILTPPSLPVFLISLLFALIAMAVHYFGVRVPFLNSDRIFDVLAIAYVVLLVGVLLRRA